MPELRRLPVELIAPNPRQPRQTFDEDALLALSESLRERGVLQPVLVRPLPGRHLRADRRRAPLARRPARRARRRPGASSRRTRTRESLELALIENMAREDLNPVEEARACALLVDELGLTREEVGRRVGRSRVAVSNLMRLLDLPDEVLDLLVEGRLTEGHGRALLTAPDHADRRRLGPRRGRRGLDGPRDRGPRPRRRRARPRSRPRRAAPSTRTSSRPPSASRTPSPAPSAPTSASPPAGRATRSRSRSTRSTPKRSPSASARSSDELRYHSAPQRAISSVG